MSIGDKIAESAEKAANKIAETTDRITEKVAEKVGHQDDAPAPTGTHRGQPAPEGDKPGLLDKLTDARERLGTKIEEMTTRHDDTPDKPAVTVPAPGTARNIDPSGKV